MIRTCGACGAKNRIPARHLADAGRCGACKATLPPLSDPLEVDGARFDQAVRGSPVPILVDFWAPWCGPCRMVAPEVHELAREMAGRALILKVNTEESPELAARFGVQSIPCFVILRGGQVLLQRAGVVPRTELRRWLESSLKPYA
jgi:thioredoxin 2